jgi:hypothetical protein
LQADHRASLGRKGTMCIEASPQQWLLTVGDPRCILIVHRSS